MSRYSQRSAQRPASSYHRPQGYFNTSAPTGYSDHDDEQATEVATDISALPLPHHHNAHASFNRTPVSSTQYFNRHLPPQAIEQHSRRGAPALSVPSGRPRASSLENRYSRPTAAALRQLQHAQSDSESEPESDEDKFTAVGTGIQTDLDLEDEVAHSTVQRQYERDPRDGKQHYRTHSALEAHDHRLSLGIKPKKDGSTEIRMKDRTKNVVMQAYSDEEVDPRAGRAYGPAPPRAIVRPSSAGSMRPGVSIYARPPKAVPKKAPVVEDSPEEKNLIRLLKDMNFSTALKDLHDTCALGVQKTIVAADGLGHAYVKVHCKKLPRHDHVVGVPHLQDHWVPIAGNRWEFRTVSHAVTIVWKSVALAAYESQTTKYGR